MNKPVDYVFSQVIVTIINDNKFPVFIILIDNTRNGILNCFKSIESGDTNEILMSSMKNCIQNITNNSSFSSMQNKEIIYN